MALGHIRGAGIGLYPQGSQYSLAAGETRLIPAGQHIVSPGHYTFVQWLDTEVTGIWRNIVGNSVSGNFMLDSDGVNFRLANLTGTQIGAVVTNAGSGYTSQPAIAAAAGSSKWTAIIGGLINTTITITAAGTYAFAPILIIPPPTQPGGVQARAHVSALSTGGIGTVVVDNQGAGYTTAPPVYIYLDPRDTASAGGGVLTTALTGSGTIAAVLCIDQGTALTAVTTLSFTGGGGSSAAATPIGVYTATTVTWATPNHSGNGNFGLISSTFPGAPTYTNPDVQGGLFLPRLGYTTYSTTASPTTTVIIDGGLHQAAPGAVLVNNSDGTINAATTTTPAYGGVTDVSFIQRL